MIGPPLPPFVAPLQDLADKNFSPARMVVDPFGALLNLVPQAQIQVTTNQPTAPTNLINISSSEPSLIAPAQPTRAEKPSPPLTTPPPRGQSVDSHQNTEKESLSNQSPTSPRKQSSLNLLQVSEKENQASTRSEVPADALPSSQPQESRPRSGLQKDQMATTPSRAGESSDNWGHR